LDGNVFQRFDVTELFPDFGRGRDPAFRDDRNPGIGRDAIQGKVATDPAGTAGSAREWLPFDDGGGGARASRALRSASRRPLLRQNVRNETLRTATGKVALPEPALGAGIITGRIYPGSSRVSFRDNEWPAEGRQKKMYQQMRLNNRLMFE
jgi:hypothetical protein